MKKVIIILNALLISSSMLVSCGQQKNTEEKPVENNSATANENPSNSSNDKLEDEFEKDAQEMGRLKCLERKASENDDSDEHNRIEGEKMLLKEKMAEKYKAFEGNSKYDEKYRLHEEIGRKICSDK